MCTSKGLQLNSTEANHDGVQELLNTWQKAFCFFDHREYLPRCIQDIGGQGMKKPMRFPQDRGCAIKHWRPSFPGRHMIF